MSCDGWSVNTRAIVASSMSTKLIRTFTSGMERKDLVFEHNVDFKETTSVTVSGIFNYTHDHEMVVAFRTIHGDIRHALLNHSQIHQLRRRPR